ncbi:hypothetical protein C8R43DRAFT_553310 [Mycena crocata]|nr:hypothetical protein C8R43DRAFT_553310 [Mycena crocata]
MFLLIVSSSRITRCCLRSRLSTPICSVSMAFSPSVLSFLPTSMSLFVEGIHVTAVSYTSNPRTLLSRRLFDSLQLPTGRPVLLTTAVPGYPSPSTSLRVSVSSNLSHDVVLGLDWASTLREFLIYLGHRLGQSFDAWQFFSSAAHPLSPPVLRLDTPSIFFEPSPVLRGRPVFNSGKLCDRRLLVILIFLQNLRKYLLLHPPLFRRQARLLRPIPLSTAPLELFSTALLDALLLLPMERNCPHLPHRMLRQVGLSSGRLMFPPWARLSTPYPCGPNYLRGLHLRGLKMLLCLYLNSIIAHP